MAKGDGRQGSDVSAKYQWQERRFWTEHAPEGRCWSMREMFSYTTDIDSFTEHLRAMAEGLERAYFTTWDTQTDPYADDGDGMFVVGLRPMTAEDKTYDDMERERKQQAEREQLAYLKEKYEIGPDQQKMEVS